MLSGLRRSLQAKLKPDPRPLIPDPPRPQPLAPLYCWLMTREPIIQPPIIQPPDDSGKPVELNDEDRDLRPQHMQDMVGQREVYARWKSRWMRPRC